jgi:ABC-type transporter Mla subunit MlaD
MESSLASIGAFTGQALQGIDQLRKFVKNFSLARQRTADLLDELQFLTSTLTDIQQLVARLEQVSNNSSNPQAVLSTTASNISTLKSQLMTCAMEVTAWVQVTKYSDPSSEKGVRAFFKKVKVAIDNSGFEEMGRKILAHRQRLGLSLSVLGRCVTTALHPGSNLC